MWANSLFSPYTHPAGFSCLYNAVRQQLVPSGPFIIGAMRDTRVEKKLHILTALPFFFSLFFWIILNLPAVLCKNNYLQTYLQNKSSVLRYISLSNLNLNLHGTILSRLMRCLPQHYLLGQATLHFIRLDIKIF